MCSYVGVRAFWQKEYKCNGWEVGICLGHLRNDRRPVDWSREKKIRRGSILVDEQILSELLIYDKQCVKGHERCKDKSRVSSLGQQ